ncbi:TetR/AcrR family transcriptional regulator [Microbacterium sp. EST19A]|uniref:TetR/AcrR family transcriptional regulator n=1 Tax=Microbacterium sp. EST19A TaxID=2862681 RepID=UPI001CC07443|nr:TetR/AcrR family transcriptional regulator [Microbacterium sp. EST19A]
MTSVAAETPPRGTRPRNRRAITIEAATELFWKRGYAGVSMSDIAEATNVGASALYRHFPGKAEVLVAAVQTGLAGYGAVLDEVDAGEHEQEGRLPFLLRRLAETSLDHRALGALWQREARSLDEPEQRLLRDELARHTHRVAEIILADRPELDAGAADLLAWCAMGVLVSPSFHSATLPTPDFVAVMVDMVSTIVSMPIPSGEQADAAVTAAPPHESRRDMIITVATELFAERGFAATGIDEIGEAVGIAGPSVYSHFENKAAILVAAIDRAHAILRIDRDEILATELPPEQKLSRLVDSYVTVANSDRAVIRILLSELMNLPEEDRRTARQLQRDYIDAWVELLRAFTDTDATSARIRVQAVLLVVNDAVQTPHLRERDRFERTMKRMSKLLLTITDA